MIDVYVEMEMRAEVREPAGRARIADDLPCSYRVAGGDGRTAFPDAFVYSKTLIFVQIMSLVYLNDIIMFNNVCHSV